MALESFGATLFRGGTSKGVFVREDRLHVADDALEDVLLAAFGSPDPMQLDGIGGSHSSTSKVVILSVPEGTDVDAAYRFGQVGVENPTVDWGGNCGNLTFAVGPAAIESGLVDPGTESGEVHLTLRNLNTDSRIEQTVPVSQGGRPRYRGEFVVDGLPAPGARIRSRFVHPSGSDAFPTGNRTDVLDVEGVGAVEATFMDVTSPAVFVRADRFGLTGRETPAAINADGDVLETLEAVRAEACAHLGFVDDARDATANSPGIPRIALVGEKRAYETVGGDRVDPSAFDLLARILSMQKAHHAYAVTGAMCTAAAATIDGTIPAEYADVEGDGDVVLGHPKGTLRVGVDRNGRSISHTDVDRTARKIMRGELFYPPR